MDSRVARCNHLIKKIQKGNEKALDALYQEFGSLFFNMAKKYLFDKNYAEDLVSEVFVELVRTSAKTFDENKNGLNWIFTIIRHKAYHYNIKINNQTSIDDTYSSYLLENYLPGINEQEEKATDILMLKQGLEKLTEDENKVLYYKYWECLTVREIAKKLDKPRSTIQYIIKESLKKLKKHCGIEDEKNEK
ncbi:MAG: sigma-70 family RNA polymerase sigma factor [Clostridia bacterium]|nr:sigma-70 family RNA polymerase sigma factor [Clostridia bacterium]